MNSTFGHGQLMRCKYHLDADLIEDYRAGDLICTQCWLVVGDRVIDINTEWRTYRADNRTNEHRTYPNSGLTTMTTTKRKSDTLSTAYHEITAMTDRFHFPQSITDRAKFNLKTAYESNKLKGRSMNAIAAACLYITCRQERIPRSLKEISAICTTPTKEIGRCVKIIMKTLKIDTGIITPEDFISRFCKILKLNGQVEFSALQISKRSNKQKTEERSPITRAAAAIYIASQHSGNPRTTDLISEVTGVGKRTIRDCSKQMEKIMKISKTNE